MKLQNSLLLIGLLALSPLTAQAVTLVPSADDKPDTADTLKARFGLSGKVTRYLPERSMLIIDNVRYKMSPLAKPEDLKLKQGLRIKYNLEVSKKLGKGRITRIWLDKETAK